MDSAQEQVDSYHSLRESQRGPNIRRIRRLEELRIAPHEIMIGRGAYDKIPKWQFQYNIYCANPRACFLSHNNIYVA